MSTVLVTGGSGFVGSHAIVQLLQAGRVVRTTVRSLARDTVVRAMVKEAGMAVPEARFAVVAADLERDEGWAEAVAGCEYVLHVASPMPPVAPKTEDEHFGVVDVRDVADLHLRAMTHPLARGERFIAVSGSAMSMLDIARVLRARLGDRARRVPTRQFPNWLVRVVARFDPGLRQLLPMLGYVRNATSAKAERILGWTPRPREDAIVATGESLLHFGLTKVQS